MKIQHIQSQYGSQIVPQWRLDELLFAVRTQVPRVTLSGFVLSMPWPLVRGF